VRDPLLGAYDPALAEAAQQAEPDDELPVIVRLTEDMTLPDGVRVLTRFGDIATLRVRRSRLTDLAKHGSVIALEASRRLRLTDQKDRQRQASDGDKAGPHASSASCDKSAAPRYSRRPTGVVATGRGVVVGVLDWGLDVAHPAFRNTDGSTRLIALWDQRGDDGSGPGNRWGYGRILSAEDIDQALQTPDPYDALNYHPADSDQQDAQSGEWKGAHGTHVTAILAGSEHGNAMTGVAPEAQLVFCHLAGTTRILGEDDLGASATVLEAADFVFSVAGDRPCVINLSVGAQGGPHDGTTLVEQGIDQAVWLKPGRAAILSAGNYAGAKAHAQGRLRPGREGVIRFSVPPGDPTDSELEIYYPAADRIAVAVIDPSGREAARVSPGQDRPLVVADVLVGHIYHRVREANADRHVDLFLRPNSPAGVWEVRLAGDVVRDGRYHAWIERDREPRPTFVTSNVDENSTTGTICNGRFSITVGAYDQNRADRPVAAFSSGGPTLSGWAKPEVVAPGVRITAARSAPPSTPPAARYGVMSGSSMATPHVAGAVVLMFESAGRPLEITETRALLFGSTDCALLGTDASAADLHRLGHGYLNIAAAEKAAREWGRGTAPNQRHHAAREEGYAILAIGGPPDDERLAAESATDDDSLAADPVFSGLGGKMGSGTAESLRRMDLSTFPPAKDDPIRLDDGNPQARTTDALPRPTSYEESISLDDVSTEMDGLRCRFVREFTAHRSDGATVSFSADAVHVVESWNGTATEALIAGFPVPKVLVAPYLERVRSVRSYDVPLDAQRTALLANVRQLRDWIAKQPSYRARRGAWERERRRLEELLGRRHVTYSRLWVRQMMYNRFDPSIAHWTQHYNRQLAPRPDLDPNIVKSLMYQESRIGTSGKNLMPPPSDWSSRDRHPIRSRFNLGQAIDSWAPQQWLMMKEMAPAIFTRHGLDALGPRRQWLSMSNTEYAAYGDFMKALQEFFEYRDGGRNLMGTPGRDLHEDYDFWIRTAIRWLFLKFSTLRRPTWGEAVRAYKGVGPASRRYRDEVMARVGSLTPFSEDLRSPESRPEELFTSATQDTDVAMVGDSPERVLAVEQVAESAAPEVTGEWTLTSSFEHGNHGAVLEDRFGTGRTLEDRTTGYGGLVAQASPKKAVRKPKKPPSSQARAEALIDELRTYYEKVFLAGARRRSIPYGKQFSDPVRVRVVKDSDWPAENEAEAKRQATELTGTYLKFNPQLVMKELTSWYRSIGKPYPDRLRTIDEHTKLTASEERVITGVAAVSMVSRARAESAKIAGMYSLSTRQIVVPESKVKPGPLVHEMAHAFAGVGWVDLMRLLDALGKNESANRLDEGMATHISSEVLDSWLAGQPAGTAKPSLGYDPSYESRALSFFGEVTEERAYEAYFGGAVDYTNSDDPLNSLTIGKTKPIRWKWPWN
jgi:subtilisin family serine protease